MRYRVHQFSLSMTREQHELEDFLNKLEGEVVAVIPNVTPLPASMVDFVLVIERLPVKEAFSEASLKEKIAFG